MGEENGNRNGDGIQTAAVNTPIDQGHTAERCMFSRALSLRTAPCGQAACCIVHYPIQRDHFSILSSHTDRLCTVLGRLFYAIRFEYQFVIKSRTHCARRYNF
jgi:hypothetical protein